MKGIRKVKAGAGAVYESFDGGTPGEGELLLKVHRASICGSDLPIYHWNSWAPQRFPVPNVFGHEFCGTVVETGAGASGFKKGDFVSVESHIYCGQCEQCQTDQRHVCRNVKIIGLDGPGGFADYARIPSRCAWTHSDDRLRDMGSLFEPFGNAVYATLVEDVSGQSVLVSGCGPQGLFAIAVARASGAKRVVAVETSAFRSELARKMGAEAVIDPTRPNALAEALRAGKAPYGFDVILEMSGAAGAIHMAVKAVRSGGRISAFGLPSQPVTIDWAQDLVFKGVRIHGIVGRKVFETWKKADGLLRSGAVDISPVVTHTYPMQDFEKGFAVMSAPEKKCGKVIFIP